MSPLAGDRTDVTSLLTRLVAADPGVPRLTWYGADGERVELSARVLANWVAKTADLLVQELLDPPLPGGGPAADGVHLLLDLPPHWRSTVWALAAWAVGVRTAAGAGAAELTVTDHPERHPVAGPTGVPLVVVALPALARVVDGAPAGSLDYNAVVAGYSDELPRDVEPLQLEVPVSGPSTGGAGGAQRVLVDADGTPLEVVLHTVLVALAGGGSVVLRGPGAPDAAHLADVERTTA